MQRCKPAARSLLPPGRAAVVSSGRLRRGSFVCPGLASPLPLPHGIVEVLVPLRGFLFAPRAGSGALLLQLRCVIYCPGVASLGRFTRDACASDPTAQPGMGPLGIGMRRPRRLPTPASASGAPLAPAGWLRHPPGGVTPAHPVRDRAALVVSGYLCTWLSGSCLRILGGELSIRRCRGWCVPLKPAACWVGGLPSAPRVPMAISPEAAGTERASRGGVSLARLHANSEGPRRGTSLLGRCRRSLGPQRAGARKGREATHPRGNTKSRHAVTKEPWQPPAEPANQRRHAVARTSSTASPQDKTRPFREGHRMRRAPLLA
jgi:hypothetical protein